MGYQTDFQGSFAITPQMTNAHRAYINQFNRTRRMKRNPDKTVMLPDATREAVMLPVGVDGEFFVGSKEDFGQDHTPDILEYNSPPSTQPGLWCQWEVNEDGELAWDEGEKFYNYVEWLEYLIANMLSPWGYKLNGQVRWKGEDSDDAGTITVTDNLVDAKHASYSDVG